MILPCPGLRAGRPDLPLANRENQTAVLSNSYELIGWHQTQVWALPAEKCFQSDDPFSGNIHLRLIHQKKLLVGERRTQAAFKGKPLDRLRIHVFVEESKTVRAPGFCLRVDDSGFL